MAEPYTPSTQDDALVHVTEVANSLDARLERITFGSHGAFTTHMRVHVARAHRLDKAWRVYTRYLRAVRQGERRLQQARHALGV